MEKDGLVSIWFGKCSTYEELKKYVAVNYTEDGDAEDSRFEKDFDIEYLDEDFMEINFHNTPLKSFSEMLKNHSYFRSIISSFLGKFGDTLDEQYNSLILLYDFDYKGEKRNICGDMMLKFIGSTSYDKSDY